MNFGGSGAQQAPASVPPLTEWPWALPAPPAACNEAAGWHGALLRRWSGTSAVMVQPPLAHHYLVMHLGGAKHVTRQRDGPTVSGAVDDGSITLVPAGTAYTWRTQGPIAFAHLYLRPDLIEDLVSREFDVDGRGATLMEGVGHRDPVLEALFTAMLREIAATDNASGLLLDALFDSLLQRLVRHHVSRAFSRRGRKFALAPAEQQRVCEYIDAHLDRPIGLADLAAAAGISASHLSHAFAQATGHPPCRYLLQRRIERAKALLLTCDEPLDAIAARCGFRSSHQFGVMFKRLVGTGPKRYALALGPRRAEKRR